MIPPINPVNTFVGILGFLRLFLSCNKYHSILLLHDNQSTDFAIEIMQTVAIYKHIFWLPTNMESVDKALFTEGASSQLYYNPNSLVINIIHGPRVANKFKEFRMTLNVNEQCDNLLIVIGDLESVQIKSILKVVFDVHVVNIGLLFESQAQGVSLIKLHYDSSDIENIKIENQSCADIQNRLFYDKTQDLRNQAIVIHMFFEVPRVINLTQIPKDGDPYPFDVGGRDAYFSTLIDYRFGTRSTNLAKLYSSEFIKENYELTKFFKEFMDKPYREDGLTPGTIDYILLDDETYAK